MHRVGFRRALGVLAGQAALLFTLGLAPQPSPVRILAESIPGAVPPEFAADLLIRAADSMAAAKEPGDWRADLYEQAFQLARSAPVPLPRYRWPVNRLDALSLQVRAFNGLLDLRRDRALELASTIEVRIPALTCRDAAIPSPTGAFDIARHSYALLERQVLSVHSSVQIAPAFEAVLSAGFPPSKARPLLTALAGTMRSLDDDDVSFTDALGPTWAAVKHAVDSSDEGSFADFMLDAFRSYLVLHLSGERCAVRSPGIVGPSAENDILSDVDETLSSRDRPRLSPTERTASRRVEAANQVRAPDVLVSGLWQTRISKNLLAQVEALRTHDQSGRPVDDRRSPEWSERLSQFYARMATWTRRDEPSVDDYLRERVILLETLVAVIPSGADRLRALGDVLVFLKSDGRQVFDANMWASRLRALIDTCRNSPMEWDWLLRALLDSEDPVMRLYAQLEQIN
jgi:hypothetical protein